MNCERNGAEPERRQRPDRFRPARPPGARNAVVSQGATRKADRRPNGAYRTLKTFVLMIDVEALRTRYRRIAGFLDERGRRPFAANEALALGRGGVTAVSAASGMARSTINRGIAELKAGSNELGERVRRRGGGRKSAVELQPGMLSALEELIEGAIRGDPQSPLRWVSRSQRNIATALRQQGFAVSQKLVGLLLRQAGLQLSGQPQDPRGQPASRPQCAVRVHQCQGEGRTRRRPTGDLGRHEEKGAGGRLQERRSRAAPLGRA